VRHLEKLHSAWNTNIIEDVTKKDLVKIYNYIMAWYINNLIFFFGATAPIWALAYLHETLCFTSVF
jgi:hypothetical protein